MGEGCIGTVCSTSPKIKGLLGENMFQWWVHMDWQWYSAHRLFFLPV